MSEFGRYGACYSGSAMQGIILLGAGGHAKVVLELLQLTGVSVIGVICPQLAAKQVSTWRGLKVLGGDDVLSHYNPSQILLVNGVGMMPFLQTHFALFERARVAGFSFTNLIHPTAIVSPAVKLGQGVQIMAGAVIQADTIIADNIIINTRAVIEHDCEIMSHCHIATGSVLCGQVKLAEGVFVGAGATIIQGIHVGYRAIIGAGTVVVKDVAERTTLRGPSALIHLPDAYNGE